MLETMGSVGSVLESEATKSSDEDVESVVRLFPRSERDFVREEMGSEKLFEPVGDFKHANERSQIPILEMKVLKEG